MNVSAIICEYNPLHQGHKYQIEKTKEITKCDGLVVLMSGNFVQRGEPAIIDKWLRTKMALNNGVDLVIELPSLYALSSAEFFAHGAVSILHNMSVINSLCFGSECGDIFPLMKIANILIKEPESYRKSLKEYLNFGLPFPRARSMALINFVKKSTHHYNSFNYEDILSSSNNILGIEYCKSLIKNNSSIIPYTITRLGSSYNEEKIANSYSSATAIRRHLKEKKNLDLVKNQLPQSSFDIIMELVEKNYEFCFSSKMYKFIKYKCLTEGPTGFLNLKDVNEGIHHRIFKFINTSESLEELIQNIKTKRYTYSRISRLLTQYFIGFERYKIDHMLKEGCSYVRVLGLNNKGAEILKLMKKSSQLNIITNLNKKHKAPLLELDIQSTAAYSVINDKINYNQDFLTSPIYLNS
jgi:predicted nucleotidyltransferase